MTEMCSVQLDWGQEWPIDVPFRVWLLDNSTHLNMQEHIFA